jgi:hypothetical protein
VRVDFLDEVLQPYRAYFAVGSLIDRLKGGGKLLYDVLNEAADENVDPPPAFRSSQE